MRRGLEAGSDRYLTKPFTREALLALLQELDARRPRARAGAAGAGARRRAAAARRAGGARCGWTPNCCPRCRPSSSRAGEMVEEMARGAGRRRPRSSCGAGAPGGGRPGAVRVRTGRPGRAAGFERRAAAAADSAHGAAGGRSSRLRAAPAQRSRGPRRRRSAAPQRRRCCGGGPPRAAVRQVAEHDAALGQVVGRQLQAHQVAGDDADVVLAHLAAGVGHQFVAVVQDHAVARVRQDFGHPAVHFDQFFLRHAGAFMPGLHAAGWIEV